jgi:hypothetical protein
MATFSLRRFVMTSALRSSVIEIVMLVLCIAWAVIFSASLLHPGKGSFAERSPASATTVAATRAA